MTALKFMKTDEINAKLKVLVKKEKALTAEIVDYIKEVGRRRIYIELGYTSLFSYLTEELCYTPASAQRRIDAARLLQNIPEMKEDLKSGALNLMQVSVLAQCLRQKAKESPDFQISNSEKKQILDSIKHQNLTATQNTISNTLELEITVIEKKKIQRDESLRIEITLTKIQCELLGRIKELISHSNPNPTFAEVFEILAQTYLKLKDPQEYKTKKPTSKKNDSEETPINNSKSYPCHDQPNNGSLSKSRFTKSNPKIMDKALTLLRPGTDNSGSAAAGSDINISINPISTQISDTKTSVTHVLPVDSDLETSGDPNLGALKKEDYRNEMHVHKSKRQAIPFLIRSLIFKRDQCCQWKNSNGPKICGSRFQLEVDHKLAISSGGSNQIKNLQLLCKVHNQEKYRRETFRRFI